MPDLITLDAGDPTAGAVQHCCRAWVRYPPRQETPCHLMKLHDNERWPARVQNLSTGGIGLHLQERVDIGRFVLVELISASGLFSRLLLTRVVHFSASDAGGFLLGGEFISELPEPELRFLLA
jgi:hypothetical protein